MVRKKNTSGQLVVSDYDGESTTCAKKRPMTDLDSESTSPLDLGTLISGPAQPRRISEGFPKDSDGRKFSPDWYNRFPWLEYSQQRDAAFCFACRHFAPTTSFNFTTFAVKGYKGWKRALGDKNKGLEKHSHASSHLAAVCRLEERNHIETSGHTVKELVSDDVYSKRQYYVRAIAEVIQFLALHELSLRGDYDTTSHHEKGGFRNLFDFMISRDERLQEIIKEIPSNATYTSPDIQNDVIDIMAKMVTDSVVHDVNNADVPCFTLLADGTRDKNHHENISIALRYVKNGKPFEALLCMPEVQKLDASALATLLLKTLCDTGVKVNNIVSQCYDGANVMSGNKGGVQRLVQNELKREVPYVHCYNHRLHPVVIDIATRISDIRIYFD